jgi:Tol biopolymer transport system component
VLERDPDFAAFPDGVPALVRQVVRLCLIKPVKERIPDIATVRLALSGAFDVSVPDASTAVPSAATPGRGRARLIAAVVLTAVVVGAVAFGVPRLMQQPFVQEPAGRFSVAPPTDQAVAANAPMPLGVSPDGRSLAIVARRLGEGTNVWIRDLDALEWREVPETNGATSIFWSPDSRFLGFFAAGQMKKVAAAGGTPIVVCRCPGGRGATWSRDDVIAFASAESPNVIEQVRASGGVPASVTTLAAGEIAHEFPVFLPDGRHFLYTTGGPSKVYVGSLDGAARTLALDQPNVSNVQFARGNLLWVREGALVTQPFDTGRMAVTGDPQPVANVRTDSPELSVSDTGVLVYVPVAKVTAAPLTWLDRGGKRIKQETVDGAISAPNLSRDGSQVAIERRDSAGSDIWVLDLRRGTNTRLTFDGQSIRPIFSGDGTRVVFGKDNTESMFLRRSSATGTEETLVPGEPTDWSPDNEHILFIRNGDLWVLSLSDRKTSAIVTGPGNDRRGRFSPDGKWIAYESDESGRFEIYVQRFPTTAERWTVSANGGGSAWWRSDGRELFFVTPDSKMMAVDVTLGRTFEQGVPRVLFGVPGRIANGRFVVSLDGQQFLMPLLADSAPPPLTVLMNWTPPGTAPVKK